MPAPMVREISERRQKCGAAGKAKAGIFSKAGGRNTLFGEKKPKRIFRVDPA